MRYVFRTDASLKIGAGHVMRSTAIAEEMISKGLTTIFIGVISEMPWLSARIRNLGFAEIYENESNFQPSVNSDVLILDSYDISVSNNFIQPQNWLAVVSIFDENTPNYNCNLRIHPGLDATWSSYCDTQTLAGPKYIPFRKSITKKINSQQKNILTIIVVGGGSDSHNFVGSLARILCDSKENFQAYLFTNEKPFDYLDERFVQILIGQSLDLIAADADLVFSTASTTCLEFIARGCAIGIGRSVSNQNSIYEKLTQLQVAIPIGVFDTGSWKFDSDKITRLINSEKLRFNLVERAENLIDYKGAERIIHAINNLVQN